MMRFFKRRTAENRDLEEYRRLMEPPDVFEDGFNWRTVVGAVFLGFIMMPGAMYLSLVVGQAGTINEAARWVTIILFAEVARRSLKDLRMQEVYILYYMAGLAMFSPFQNLLWNQYLVQSEYARAMGIAQEIPAWFAPQPEVIRAAGRTFFTRAWLAPVGYIAIAMLVNRVDNFGLGYVLYRITSDGENLPFPMAPVGASGITALVERGDEKQRWRWRCFSIGGMIGMVFGIFYVALPAVTGSFLARPIQLIPLPFVDLTPALGRVLPAVPLNITLDIGLIITGMVLPFWAVIGGILGVIITMVANPLLYRNGILSNWQPGMDVVDTIFVNNVDFYLSFGLGLTLAITLISLGQILKPLLRALRTRNGARELTPGDVGGVGTGGWRRITVSNKLRGDFSIWIALGLYLASSVAWIGLSSFMIPSFPWKFFVVYAVLIVPTIAYAQAKIEGLIGQGLVIPMIREATFILSGYRGVQIWFAPVPFPLYGNVTRNFRVLELTGTKVKSIVKTQLVAFPIIIVASLIFSQLLWTMAEVPSEAYPFTMRMWDLQAKTMCLTFSSTMEGGSLFFEALKFRWLFWGAGAGVTTYLFLSFFGLPTLLVFGLVRGLGQGTPAVLTFELIGALVGRFYFKRRFGKQWLRYTPVLLAGYACGMGLVAMVGMAVAILNRMMSPLIF